MILNDSLMDNQDVLQSIFRQLSSKHRLRLTQVSKSWQAILIKVSKRMADEYRYEHTNDVILAIKHKDYHTWMIDNFDDQLKDKYSVFMEACQSDCVKIAKRISLDVKCFDLVDCTTHAMMCYQLLQQKDILKHHKIATYLLSLFIKYNTKQVSISIVAIIIQLTCQYDLLLTLLEVIMSTKDILCYAWYDVLLIASMCGNNRIKAIAGSYSGVITVEQVNELRHLGQSLDDR